MVLNIMGVQIARDTKICGHSWIYGRGRLEIKTGTWISPGAKIYTNSECKICIGKNVDIGPFVKIIAGSHRVGDCFRRAGIGYGKDVEIGNGVWIGTNCTLIAGVTIGDGAIIAAGSVVTSDIPSNCMAAGVPARVKKFLEGIK